MVGNHKSILILTVVSLLSLSFFDSALAMPEYAKRFKLACTFCHSKFPLLNEFGTSFLKDNPTPPDMKLPRKADDNMSPQSDGEMPGNKNDGKSIKAPGDAVYDNLSGSRSTSRVEPPAPTIVYRRVDRDGNLVFTDNPPENTLRQDRQKSGIDTIKTIATRKNNRPAKQVKAQPPVNVEHTNIDAKSGNPPERYRSYEDCMEKILLGSKQPATVDEIMVVFVEAEKACRQFSRVQ